MVTDGDVNSYLFDTFVRKERLKKVNAARGYYFKQDEAEEPITVGATVYDDQLRVVENDVINLSDRSVFIKNGKIVSINYYKTLWTDKGQIRVTSNVTGKQIGRAHV